MFKFVRRSDKINLHHKQLSIGSMREKRQQIVKGCDKRHYFFTNRLANEIVKSENTNIWTIIEKRLSLLNHHNFTSGLICFFFYLLNNKFNFLLNLFYANPDKVRFKILKKVRMNLFYYLNLYYI